MDAMKYSMDADKYRPPYIPPSSLAMSMYSDPKYLDSTAKSYLDRSYLDSTSALTKAYFENSKMYIDNKSFGDVGNSSQSRSSPNYEIGKSYESNSRTPPPAPESPESSNVKSERPDPSSSTSTSASSATASPGSLPPYYPQHGGPVPPGLIPMSQYSQHYHQASGNGGSEFRRPLTVIF